MSDILFNIVRVLGGQPPARSVATVCSVVHFTVCLSRFTKIYSFWFSSLTIVCKVHLSTLLFIKLQVLGGSSGTAVV